jgi:hypothetical protein
VPWIGNAGLQGAVIGQQQQALAVMIESTGRMISRRAQVIGKGRSILLRREARQHAVGLVE